MNRTLSIGLLLMLLATVGMMPRADAEQPACDCTEQSRCLCLFFKYAQFLGDDDQWVYCFFGMLCEPEPEPGGWAGTIAYEDTVDRTVGSATCQPGQTCTASSCFNPDASKPGGQTSNTVRQSVSPVSQRRIPTLAAGESQVDSPAVPEDKRKKKPSDYMKPEIAKRGAQKLPNSKPKFFGQSDGYTAKAILKKVSAEITLPGRDRHAKLWLIQITEDDPGSKKHSAGFVGLGLESDPDPSGHVLRIGEDQVEYVDPDGDGKTRAILAKLGSVTFRVFLAEELSVPSDGVADPTPEQVDKPRRARPNQGLDKGKRRAAARGAGNSLREAT